MRSFEEIRSHLVGKYPLTINDPYLISFNLDLPESRRQGIFLTEIEDEAGHRFLRVSTPIGPLEGVNARRCLRFNWEQRTGYLAVGDLDGEPYLHLCENCRYRLLDPDELDRVIGEIGPLADELEGLIGFPADVH